MLVKLTLGALAIVFVTLSLFGGAADSQPISPPPAKAPTPATRPAALLVPVSTLLGIDTLEERLGEGAPTGRGIRVGHVEGGPGDYLPHLSAGNFAGVHFNPQSGPSKISGHTHATCKIIYGPAGLAPGIQTVDLYSSTFWTNTYLHTGKNQPPVADQTRIFTHSWIGGGGAWSERALRRIDYLIDTRDMVMCVGVNNGGRNPVPAMLASAYNVIAVGTWTGDSSGGYTLHEGVGRCKPDIVAPRGLTSFTTPATAAVVARLLEIADRMKDKPEARRSELIKAVLMAGAAKIKGWAPEPGKPLDNHLGAGSVRIDQSYNILAAGPPDTDKIGRYGWSFRALEPGADDHYYFTAPAEMGEASIMLVWNRRIDGRIVNDLVTQRPRWSDMPRLAHLDLTLQRLGESEPAVDVASSTSAVDNVQHIYVDHLPAGRYCLTVKRKDALPEPWDYALAWRVEQKDAISAQR